MSHETALDGGNLGDVEPTAGDGEEPKLAWGVQQSHEFGVVATLTGLQNSPYIIAWGDGMWDENANQNILTHTYPGPGNYRLSAWHMNFTELWDSTQLVVRHGTEPAVEFVADPEVPGRMMCRFVDDGLGLITQHKIEWPSGAVREWSMPGGHVSAWMDPGEYSVRVTDEGSKRIKRFPVTMPATAYDPDVELTAGEDGYTVVATVTAASAGKGMLIDWGDGVQESVQNAKVGTVVRHTYAQQDPEPVKIVQVSWEDGSSPRFNGKLVTLPMGHADE